MSFAWPLALDPVGSTAVTGREPHLHLKQHLAQSLQEGRLEAATQPFPWLCPLCPVLAYSETSLGDTCYTLKRPRGQGSQVSYGSRTAGSTEQGSPEEKGKWERTGGKPGKGGFNHGPTSAQSTLDKHR